jgi:hypothetical protein
MKLFAKLIYLMIQIVGHNGVKYSNKKWGERAR